MLDRKIYKSKYLPAVYNDFFFSFNFDFFAARNNLQKMDLMRDLQVVRCLSRIWICDRRMKIQDATAWLWHPVLFLWNVLSTTRFIFNNYDLNYSNLSVLLFFLCWAKFRSYITARKITCQPPWSRGSISDLPQTD